MRFLEAERKVSRVAELLSKITGTIAGITIGALMIAMVLDLVVRNVSGGSIPGVVEYSEVAMVIIVYLSLGYAQHARAHVAVDILFERLPSHIAAVWNVVLLIAAGVLLVWMTYETTQAGLQSWSTGEFRYGLVSAPMWPARFAIPIGFGVMALQCFADAWRDYTRSRADSKPPTPDADLDRPVTAQV